MSMDPEKAELKDPKSKAELKDPIAKSKAELKNPKSKAELKDPKRKAESKNPKSIPAAAANGPPLKPVPKSRGRFDPPIRTKARAKKPKYYASNDTLAPSSTNPLQEESELLKFFGKDSELKKLLQLQSNTKSSGSRGKN